MTSFLHKQPESNERRSHAGESSNAVAHEQEVTIVDSALFVCTLPPIDRERLVAETAYRLAESRGFAPGHELDDWLAAEAEVDERLWREGRMS